MFIYPALITALALILFQVVSFNVGRARRKYGVKLPHTTGNDDFERVYRVQQNTMEQLVFFLPALWLFAIFASPIWATLLGGIWVIARILYAYGYTQSVAKRMPWFVIAFSASSVLLLGGIVGMVLELLAQ